MRSAARNRLEALRDAASQPEISQNVRMQVEALIKKGLIDQDAYDLQCALLGYVKSERTLRAALHFLQTGEVVGAFAREPGSDDE